MPWRALFWPAAIVALLAAFALIPSDIGMLFGWAAVLLFGWRGAKLFSTPAGGMRNYHQ